MDHLCVHAMTGREGGNDEGEREGEREGGRERDSEIEDIGFTN